MAASEVLPRLTDGSRLGALDASPQPGRSALLPGDEARSPSERSFQRTDADLIEQFLRERCSRSVHTEASYRSQLRRLGWFCHQYGMRSIREMQREQWPDFKAYLRQPPKAHIMGASVGYGKPGWAPFRGPLTDRSAKQAEIVARSFFDWLSDPAIGAVQINPVASVRTHTARRSATTSGVERYLNEQEQTFLQRAVDDLPFESTGQRRARARARWVVSLAILTGLRASEIAGARLSDIRPGSATGSFSLHLVRKGGVQAQLPLHSEVLIAWREHLAQYEGVLEGLVDLPLVLPTRDADLRPPLAQPTRAHIWRIVKEVMRSAADLALEEGDTSAEYRLRQASTHWLRHTFATNLLEDGAELLSVRDLMDHASITTTNQYLHRPEEKQRADLEKMRRRG